MLSLKVRLRAAYENGQIELFYPEVFAYTLAAEDVECGHYDWRYDELRLSKARAISFMRSSGGARPTMRAG